MPCVETRGVGGGNAATWESEGEGKCTGGTEELLHTQPPSWHGNGEERSAPQENANTEFLVLN